jgi:hypothetical protein
MVPLASIMPPATLIVQSAPEVPLVHAHVPVPQFVGRLMADVLDG